ncbi:hypothetical protein C1I98_24645 [Spongiactinospora gelatinilytica]|uniref:Uncharacterized protein n=1 Tax=Spongiactinospora gelatinilytica TaxID=2666298 RepID=A0A2W2G6N2_9ACTN|nr:hypothetical protein [Spongiactinospora gelatinilytica]PZG38099.1 hypothetical protein C1I98_24645 [Spongiactinospora gelatinilytica]
MARKQRTSAGTTGAAELFPAEGDASTKRSRRTLTPRHETPRSGRPLRTKGRADTMTLSARLHAHLDDRLTVACERTGHGPKGIVEEAIHNYADALGVPAELPQDDDGFTEAMPHDYSNRKNRRPDGEGTDPDLLMLSVRVRPITRARMWHCCVMTGQGVQSTMTTLLNLYLHKLGVPQNVHRDAKGRLRRSG